jgi:hypothetical protein
MNEEGPQLVALMHRLSECPEDFVSLSDQADGAACTLALTQDFFRRFGDSDPIREEPHVLDECMTRGEKSNPLPYFSLLGVTLWLFYDPWFDGKSQFAKPIWNVIQGDKLRALSHLLRATQIVADPDRREELVRICLNGLNLRPQGESVAQASDRLMSLDSVERERILRETAAAEKRAREIREAMAKAKAMESVSRYGE